MVGSKIKRMKRSFVFGGHMASSQVRGIEWNADIVVIGSGPAGLSAAIAAKAQGAKHVIVVERLQEIGGLLPQCIHSGFGMRMFGEELTGPEYAKRLIQLSEAVGVEFLTDAFVTEINGMQNGDIGDIPRRGGKQGDGSRAFFARNDEESTRTVPLLSSSLRAKRSNPEHFTVNVLSPKFADPISIESKAVILATGCRERPIGALSTPKAVTGTRPSGVFTAGTAQRMINIGGYRMGKRAVVLGSGDIGLIVARRLTLTGTEVAAVFELSSTPGGMAKNRRECLDAYGIPLLTKRTITQLHGNSRLEAVTVSEVDDAGRLRAGSEYTEACDTLIVSVGLIPETELLNEMKWGHTSARNVPGDPGNVPEGIFVCGNALKIEQMADDIADDGTRAGIMAAEFIEK